MPFGSITCSPPKIEPMRAVPPKIGGHRAQVVQELLKKLELSKRDVKCSLYGYAAEGDETPFFNTAGFRDAAPDKPVWVVVRRPRKENASCTISIGDHDFFIYRVTVSPDAGSKVTLNKLGIDPAKPEKSEGLRDALKENGDPT